MSNENQHDMSEAEVLERLKRSYAETPDDSVKQPVYADDAGQNMSEEELKEKLRLQFSSQDTKADEPSDDPYSIDQDFMAEAESAFEDEEALVPNADEGGAILEEEAANKEDLVEFEIYEDDISDESLVNDDSDTFDEESDFDEYIEQPIEKDLESYGADIYAESQKTDIIADTVEELDELEPSENDDITFDELENDSYTEDDGIILTKIELEDHDESQEISEEELSFFDDDVTFDDLEDFEQGTDEFVLTRIDVEENSSEKIRTMILDEKLKEELEYLSEKGEVTPDDIEYVAENEQKNEEAESEHTLDQSGELETDDFLSEFFDNEAEKTNEDTVFDAYVKNAETDVNAKLDNSEISLLMQFGCEADDINKYVSDVSNIEIDDEKEIAQEEGESQEEKRKRILEQYSEYTQMLPGIVFRFAISSVMALVIMIYELLPLLGIINRGAFPIPYILIGIACAIACVCPSYKQLWDGAKQIAVNKPTGYSMVFILSVVTLIYDVSLFFLKSEAETYPVFHFLLACVMVIAILYEWQLMRSERKCFEFFFKDILDSNEEKSESDVNQSKVTLYLSEGKNSTAEKMYAGGLDASQKIYTAVETNRVEASLGALKKISKKRQLSMYFVIPSVVLSVVMLFVALIMGHDIQAGFCAMMITLLLTLPVVALISVWLPFDRMRAKGNARGYSFASEASMEHYSNADMLIFKDTHLFSKITSSNVNLVLYDATPNDVLLACLDCVYSRIGGPMSDSFKGGKKNFENCRIVRIAKSGIEAVVENNYSVLIGSEAFMQRYGISFPNVSLNNAEDKVFTLCVSINGRASARLAARYSANDMFEMFSSRLYENGIYCVIETFDPMINTELIARVLPQKHTPLNIVHLNAQNLGEKNINENDAFLFDVVEKELEVITHTSRLNLAVALTDAKQMKKLRKRVNLLSAGFSALGLILTLLAVLIGFTTAFNEFWVFLVWGLSFGGLLTLILCTMPKNYKFSFEHFLRERELLESIEENTEE